MAGHETNLDQEIRADQTGQYRHLEGKNVLRNSLKNQKLSPFKEISFRQKLFCFKFSKGNGN